MLMPFALAKSQVYTRQAAKLLNITVIIFSAYHNFIQVSYVANLSLLAM